MNDHEHYKAALEAELDRVKNRLRILHMIYEKLFAMKGLALSALEENLPEEKIENLNYKFKKLEHEVKLLDHGSTKLC